MIFGFSFSEIFFLVVFSYVILGPEKFKSCLRSIILYFREFRNLLQQTKDSVVKSIELEK
jgi:Sec-independent protein translocase protein TatA